LFAVFWLAKKTRCHFLTYKLAIFECPFKVPAQMTGKYCHPMLGTRLAIKMPTKKSIYEIKLNSITHG
jgi:hypothetical protein